MGQEAFGFPVGRITPEGPAPDAGGQEGAGLVLRAWAESTGAAIVSAAVPAAATDWMILLPRLGFVCIDLAVSVSLTRFRHRPRTVRAADVRPAQPADRAAVVEIAGAAFDFGRYHRDPRFPRVLADRRFASGFAVGSTGPCPGSVFWLPVRQARRRRSCS